MKVLKKGKLQDGTDIQIEEWNESYNFMPYASTIASYPLSKISINGQFVPKVNEKYRFQFDFKSEKEADIVFNNLITGKNTLSDYKK